MIKVMEATETPTAPDPTDASPSPAEPGSGPEDAPQGASEGTDDTGGERDETGKWLSREAAQYRRRLRDTETELERTRQQLDRLQRGEVERLASAAGLAVPGDVWLHGATLDTLRGEDGNIDAETVSGLVQELVRDRPGLRAQPAGSFRVGEGSTAAGRLGQRSTPGLSDLLKPGQR